jgi:hypothetical protein
MPVGTGVRRAAGIVALLLFAWMLLLLFRQPTITYDQDTEQFGVVDVRCGSVIGVGWPTGRAYLVDQNGSGLYSDGISGGRNLSQTTRAGIYRDCADRRTTYVGGLAILAVPTTLLGVLAILPRRRADHPAARQG